MHVHVTTHISLAQRYSHVSTFSFSPGTLHLPSYVSRGLGPCKEEAFLTHTKVPESSCGPTYLPQHYTILCGKTSLRLFDAALLVAMNVEMDKQTAQYTYTGRLRNT